jgi:hypothetical protein
MSAAAPAGAATDERLARVVASREAIAPGDAVRVSVRLGRGARLRVLVGSRSIAGRFGPSRDGVRTARLQAGKELERGVNDIGVYASAGRRSDFDSVEVVVGRRDRGFLSVAGAPRGSTRRTPVVTARWRVAPHHLRARLNGHDVRREFLTGAGTTKPAHLGPDDGLRFARNRLVVSAYDERGRNDREVRTFRVSRSAPLVAAGPVRRTTRGKRVRLDARRSRATRRGHRLHFRWSVVRAPKGSKPTLTGARGARPRLLPDKVGRYRLRLRVIETLPRARSAQSEPLEDPIADLQPVDDPDELTARTALVSVDETEVVGATPTPPIGATLATIPETGPNGIVLDGQVQPPLDQSGQPTDWVQLLVLNRQTRAVVEPQSRGYAYAENPQDLSNAIGGLDSSHLAILTGGGRPQPNLDRNHWNTLKYAYRQLGGKTYQGSNSSQMDPGFRSGKWSLIGIPHLDQGQAFTSSQLASTASPSQSGSLSGYLQLDMNVPPNYGFTFGDYVSFDTNETGQTSGQNVMTVGNASYSSEPLSEGQAGFQVVVLNAGNLLPVPEGNETFVTNESATQSNDAGVNAMNAFIKSWASNQTLFLIQSIGSPTPLSSAWVQTLAPTIASLGGSPSVLNALPAANGGYTLVAPSPTQATGLAGEAWAIPEDSASKPPVQLVGSLSRNRQAVYHAPTASPIEGYQQQMMPIAYQPPQEWPFTDTTDPKYAAYQAAMGYIAQQLDLGYQNDIRINYYQANFVQQNRVGDLLGVNYPNPATGCPSGDTNPYGNGYSPADFCDVRAQLVHEFQWVNGIYGLIDVYRGQINQAEIQSQSNIETTASNIIDAVGANEDSDREASVLADLYEGFELFSYGADVAGGAGAVAGGIASALALAGEAANSSEGNPLLAEIETEAQDLGGQVQQNLANALPALDHAGDLLVSDYGKLKTAGPLSLNAQTGWDLGPTAADKLPGMLDIGTDRFFYRLFIDGFYKLWELRPGFSPDPDLSPPAIEPQWVSRPQDYECFYDRQGEPYANPIDPFDGEPDSAWWPELVAFGEGPVTRPRALAAQVDYHSTAAGNTVIDWDGGSTPITLPPASLTDPLFTPLGQTTNQRVAGLGMAKPEFFDQAFQLHTLECPKAVSSSVPRGPPRRRPR